MGAGLFCSHHYIPTQSVSECDCSTHYMSGAVPGEHHWRTAMTENQVSGRSDLWWLEESTLCLGLASLLCVTDGTRHVAPLQESRKWSF